MSTRLRILLKLYPPNGGWSCYKGGDAIRFLEHTCALKMDRPIRIAQLKDFFAHSRIILNHQKKNLEICVWRVKRHLNNPPEYIRELDCGKSLLRFSKKGEGIQESVLVGKIRKKAKNKQQVGYKFKMQFQPAQVRALRDLAEVLHRPHPIVDIEAGEFLEPEEPRDR